MAMIFVHDYRAKRRRKDSLAIWAIPCSNNLGDEEVRKRVLRSMVECYSGLIFNDRHGNVVPTRTVADAVMSFAVSKQRSFWEYQRRPCYVAVTEPSIGGGVSYGLQDIEKAVCRNRRWTQS